MPCYFVIVDVIIISPISISTTWWWCGFGSRRVLHISVHLYRCTTTTFSKLFCVCHTHCAQSERLLKEGRQNGLCLTRLCQMKGKGARYVYCTS